MTSKIPWIVFGLVLLLSQNVFCSKIKQSRKQGKTVDPGKKAEIGNFDTKKDLAKIDPEDCKDKNDNCQEMQNNAACLLNRQYMGDKCMLTCRFCSPGRKTKQCKDEQPEKCKSWGKKDCVYYTPFMKDVCAKTCQLCGTIKGVSYHDTDERCPEWGGSGVVCHARRNQTKGTKSMLQQCPYSCRKYWHRRFHAYRAAIHPKHNTTSVRHHHPHHKIRHVAKVITLLTEDQKEENEEIAEEWKEEVEERAMEKAEQDKVRAEVNMHKAVIASANARRRHIAKKSRSIHGKKDGKH